MVRWSGWFTGASAFAVFTVYLGAFDSVPYLVRVAPEVYREAYSCGTVFAPAFPRDGRGPCTDLLNGQMRNVLILAGIAVVLAIIGAAKQSSDGVPQPSQTRPSEVPNFKVNPNPAPRPSTPPEPQGPSTAAPQRSTSKTRDVTPTSYTGVQILAHAQEHDLPTDVVDAARKASLFSATITAWCISAEPSCLLLVYGDQIWRFNSFSDWTRLTSGADGFVSDEVGRVVSLQVGTTTYRGLTPAEEADRVTKVLGLREMGGMTPHESAPVERPSESSSGTATSEADPVAHMTHARQATTVRERLRELRSLMDDGLITPEQHDSRVDEILREV